jgi:hypothetical protein
VLGIAYYLSNCIQKFTEAEATIYMLCKSKCPDITTEYHHHISNCKYIFPCFTVNDWVGMIMIYLHTVSYVSVPIGLLVTAFGWKN